MAVRVAPLVCGAGAGFVCVGISHTIEVADGAPPIIHYDFAAGRFPLVGGRARIAPLEPGSQMVVAAQSAIGPLSDTRAVTLPAASGAVAQASLYLAATGGQITARFVGADGQVLSNGVVTINGGYREAIDSEPGILRIDGHG